MVEAPSVRSVPAPSVPVHNIMRARLSNSRISLPVNRHVMYARFKHIQGVPAHEEGAGLSVSRLRVLDTMIDRLIAARKGDTLNIGEIAEDSAEEMIRRVENELRSALQKLEVGPNGAGYGVGILQSGAFFSFAV
jgi:hypothetical protein